MGRRLWSIQLQYVLFGCYHLSPKVTNCTSVIWCMEIYLALSYYFIYFVITKTIYTTVDLNTHSEKDMALMSLYYNQPH